MTNFISALAISLAMATATEKPSETTEEGNFEIKTLAFARCEIIDHKNGFYGKGNCEKLMKAYAAYLELKK